MAPLALNSLRELFIHELRDLYSAERQLEETLPKMARAASRSRLEKVFNTHLRETRSHLERLEGIFESLDTSPEGEKSEAIAGMIEQTNEILRQEGQEAVQDAALISAAQRIKHYEMSGYGTARTHAEELGLDTATNVLDAILSEEKSANRTLNRIALGGWLSEGINIEAQKETETKGRTPGKASE